MSLSRNTLPPLNYSPSPADNIKESRLYLVNPQIPGGYMSSGTESDFSRQSVTVSHGEEPYKTLRIFSIAITIIAILAAIGTILACISVFRSSTAGHVRFPRYYRSRNYRSDRRHYRNLSPGHRRIDQSLSGYRAEYPHYQRLAPQTFHGTPGDSYPGLNIYRDLCVGADPTSRPIGHCDRRVLRPAAFLLAVGLRTNRSQLTELIQCNVRIHYRSSGFSVMRRRFSALSSASLSTTFCSNASSRTDLSSLKACWASLAA